MELQLREEQKQVLGQYAYQSMQILALNTLELESLLNDMAKENPLLEVEPPREVYSVRAAARSTGGIRPFIQYHERDASREDGESLAEYLLEQVAMMKIDAEAKKAVRFLAGNLDERGYLMLCEEDIHGMWPAQLFERALSLLQTLEPAGVGARNLGECLTIQLRRQGEKDFLPYVLAENFMERLGRGQIHHIARELNVSAAQVTKARDRLVRLTPKPGNGFGRKAGAEYIIPDIEFIREEGPDAIQAVVAEKYLPRYSVSGYYAAMLERESLTTEERQYFHEKLRKARWILECIERRKNMLLACARIIAQSQCDFIRDGKSALRPLSMKQIADELNVHPSTVYRTVQDKYVACGHGIYPMANFFMRGAAGGLSVCVEESFAGKAQIAERIRALVGAERKDHPLSDRSIAEILQKEGLNISRRTVAKYREEALIPASSIRRRRQAAEIHA